jgi:hypothetical protein
MDATVQAGRTLDGLELSLASRMNGRTNSIGLPVQAIAKWQSLQVAMQSR